MNSLGVIIFGVITSVFSLVLFVISFIAAANKARVKDYVISSCSLITFIFTVNILLM